MDERDETARNRRIKERAYRMWQDEGSPDGRADAHWDQAAELVAIEENHGLAMEKVPSPDDLGPSGEPIEPIEAVQNAGEFPTTTDQGEQIFPTRRKPESVSESKAAATAPKPVVANGQNGGAGKAGEEARRKAGPSGKATPKGKAPPPRAPRK